MIFPAQTSLIPIQVALARFLEQGGSVFANYPYWYLGTTPFRYLTGPFLPGILVLLHKILPGLPLFEIMLGLIGISWLVGGVGVYWLVETLILADRKANRHLSGLLAAALFVCGPIVPFLFRFSDGIYLITFSFLPFVLLFYLKFLKLQTLKWGIFLCLAIAFVILLDSLIIPSLFLGLLTIFLANFGWGKIEKRLKQTVIICCLSLLIATFWYTPFYWLTLLGAPSLNGQGLAGVILWLGKLLPTSIAVLAAFFSLKFFKKSAPVRNFCLYWLLIFGLLTGIRFLSDPDFWLDWTAYGPELQLGIALGLALAAQKLRPFWLLPAGYLILFAFIFNRYVWQTFQPDINLTVEYRIGNELVKEVKPGERVFLSGTIAFWLNSLFDIPQVRGGVDQVAVDGNWRRLTWQIRETQNLQEALESLKKLGADYLVVHSSASSEFYHDFVHPEYFEQTPHLTKIYEGKGDIIYRLP